MKALNHLFNVLAGVESMNTEKLQRCLKEDYSYQDTTKEVFLTQLEKIFEEHRESGDTRLKVYHGKCAGEGCGNCGKHGYQFVGNVSRNYLSLIIETDSEKRVIDIYGCNEFKTNNVVENLESADWIYINADDLITFNKTPEYLAKVKAANAAFDELLSDQRSVNLDDICYWLDKHEFTMQIIANDEFAKSRMKWSQFVDIYSQLKELREYVSIYQDVFSRANHSYQSIKEEKQLITWMLEFEELYSQIPYEFKYNIIKRDDCYMIERFEQLTFNETSFTGMFGFINSYQKHHLDLLNKYGIYTEDEISEIIAHEEYDYSVNPVYSLKFHLERRVEAANIGIDITFNLNGYSI